jgi:hypothetical protein
MTTAINTAKLTTKIRLVLFLRKERFQLQQFKTTRKIRRDNEFENEGSKMRPLCPTLSFSQEFNFETEEKQEHSYLG